LNPAKFFLNAELERVEQQLAHLYRIDNADVALRDELRHYRELVLEVLAQATTDEAVALVAARLADRQMLHAELAPDDVMAARLAVEVAYLEGLHQRLQKAITQNTFVSRLQDVDRL
jgi:hypothetical protein